MIILAFLMFSALAARAASKRHYGWLTWNLLFAVLEGALLIVEVVK